MPETLYEMNESVAEAVRTLQHDGYRHAIIIYSGTPFAYSAIWRSVPDWVHFKLLLHNAIEAGQRRGHSADEVIDTFCSLCMIDPKLVLPMIA